MMITDEPYVDMLKMQLWSPDHLLSKSNCLGLQESYSNPSKVVHIFLVIAMSRMA